MDYSNEARQRIEKHLDKLDRVMEELEEIGGRKNIIENRKYIISAFLESYSTWSKQGDCLPKDIRLGRYSNNYLQLRIVEMR